MTPHPIHWHIAGAGLLGSLLAWRLARQGMPVSVYEQASAESPQAAAWTAAGMVAPWSEAPLCHSQVFQQGLQSLALWPALLEELAQDTGIRVAYGQSGSVLVAHPADKGELLQFGRSLRQHGGWPGGRTDSVQPLQVGELQALEPALNPQLLAGFWLPQEAHIDNRALLVVLQQAAQQAGAVFHFNHPVATLPVGQARPQDIWLDCRGTGARSDMPALRAVRGEVLWLDSAEVNLSRPVRLLHPRYHLYLVPKGQVDGRYRYVLGATEIDSDDRSPVSVRSALELLSAAYSLCPALAEARILSFEVNCRPALPDHQPCIVPLAGQGLRINGLFRHGYLLAPAVLQQLQTEFDLPLQVPVSEAAPRCRTEASPCV
ncbi:FAD-dependent oxidoreductase [Venatoribacter cucullus]|uniref:FAD-dependent oxidoreductase n=1 Tax=Venatoribacter cucullus TaxID=2661630 RepID=A0A9X7UWS3_9GAMM|nr:FAD-dependent oxidoreductase [Venatoribacter cucullus]QQD24487.1 FAD-dependent oxidoreductase [Venatoribacter cucullus]